MKLTDTLGFKSQSLLLLRMFHFVESDKITEPVYTPEQAQAGTSNKNFLRNFVGNLLQTAFPNLNRFAIMTQTPNILLIGCSTQIYQFVEGLFLYSNDQGKFKLHLRDFLIQLKEFTGDNSELYAEDREAAQKAAQDAERERAIKVGGLLKPADIDQDDEL